MQRRGRLLATEESEYWHTSRYFNTKFYHALTKRRHARNRVVGLHVEGGHWIKEDKGV